MLHVFIAKYWREHANKGGRQQIRNEKISEEHASHADDKIEAMAKLLCHWPPLGSQNVGECRALVMGLTNV